VADLLALEYTWYDKKTKDALVSVPALPSLGFPGVQFRNIGAVENRGMEISLNGDLFRSPHADLALGFKFSHNSNKVVTLGGTPSLLMNATFGQSPAPGFPLGT